MATPEELEPVPRSGFVTGTAGVVIVMAGLATIVSFVQSVAVSVIFPAVQQEIPPFAPALTRFMFTYMRELTFAALAVSAVWLASGVGLLKRRNWARRLFIVLLWLAIIWNIAGLAVQHSVAAFMDAQLGGDMNGPPEQIIRSVLVAVRILAFVMAAAFCVLFGWLIKRFTSARVRAEFLPPGSH